MAGTNEWSEQKKKLKQDITDARASHTDTVAEFQHASTIALQRSSEQFQEPVARLCSAIEASAGATGACLDAPERFESRFGDALEELLVLKARAEFARKHCDFIHCFELCVLCRMRHLTKYQEALAQGAEPPQFSRDVLELLRMMAHAEESPDEEFRQVVLTPENVMLRDAWNEAVVACGLLPEELAALRVFKCITDFGPCFHDSPSPAEALEELKRGRLPALLEADAQFTQLRGVLMKLLELLVVAGRA